MKRDMQAYKESVVRANSCQEQDIKELKIQVLLLFGLIILHFQTFLFPPNLVKLFNFSKLKKTTFYSFINYILYHEKVSEQIKDADLSVVVELPK